MNTAAKIDYELMTEKEYRRFLDTHILTAKLLATENISVMFSQKLSAPAVFDIKNRALKLAPLVKKQLFLTLGLIIHEVGHALFTNPTKAEMAQIKGISVIMNIIEDGYQERKMCIKFPGAKKHLKTVFDHFFSDEEEAAIASKVKTGNRKNSKVIQITNVLNYNCKGIKFGVRQEYPAFVRSADLILLHAAENLNRTSYMARRQMALDLSKMLRYYLDKNEQQDDGDGEQDPGTPGSGQSHEADQKFFEDDDDDDDEPEQKPESGEGESGEGESGEGESGEGESGEGESGEGESDEADDAPSDGKPSNPTPGKSGGKVTTGGSESPDGTPDVTDKTDEEVDETDLDEVFAENSDALNDHHKKFEHIMGSEDDAVNNVYGMPSYELLKTVSERIDINGKSGAYKSRLENFRRSDKTLAISDSTWKRDMVEAKKTANRIFTQFNMRRMSKNLANTSYKKNGSLDTTRLSMYKIYDDIFANIEMSPDVTNHAYVAVVDWSGSMDASLYQLTHRIMELVFFANMAEVELEVVLYTTTTYGNTSIDAGKFPDMAWNGSKFIHVVNTKKHNELTAIDRLHALWYASIWMSGSGSTYGSSGAPMSDIDTHGTNILEGTIYGHGILEHMQAQKKSLFVLTDGDDENKFNKVNGPRGIVVPNNPSDLIFMGSTINNLIDHTVVVGSLRCRATRVICDFYKSMGHRTISISWNCNAGQVKQNASKFGGLNVNFAGNQNQTNGYYKVENVFITDLIKGII